MIQTIYFTAEQGIKTNLTLEELPAALADDTGFLWIDFIAEIAEISEPIMREVFGFHPLAIDDALNEAHVSKVDDWGDYLYVVFHAMQFEPNNDDYVTAKELDIFVGKNYLVTYQMQPVTAVRHVWDVCLRDQNLLGRGSVWVLYHLVDELATRNMDILRDVDHLIGQFEDEIFKDPDSYTLEQILQLKRGLLRLWRNLVPEQEVLRKLSRDSYPIIKPEMQAFFRDVYDHLARIHGLIESMRDLVNGLLDTYLSVVNNRMNEVMKTLTVITTLFMPLSFIVGFFGMNFFGAQNPPQMWTSTHALEATLAVMIALPLGMYWWMNRRSLM